MDALLHQLAHQPPAARAEQDGAALQLSVPDDLPRRVLGAVSLRAGAARAAHGRAADGHGARRRLLRAADDDGERARARRVAPLPADAGVDGDARRGHGRRALPAPGRRGTAAARAGDGARHAAAAASARSLRGVHVRRVRVHRARPGHRDDGRQRARGAGARAVHLSADADHRRRRGPAREPAGLGAAPVGVLSRAVTRSRQCRRASPATGWAPPASACSRSSLIGAAGCLAGAKMFRWDAEQRFARRRARPGSRSRSRRG